MSRTASWLAFVPLLVVTGCGGSSTSVQGSVAGKGFGSAHAVSNDGGATKGEVGILVISDVDNLCAQITANSDPTNAQILSVELFEIDATSGQSSAPSHSGAYSIAAGNGEMGGQFASAYFVSVGAVSTDEKPSMATAGSVTLSDFSNGKYSGSFDLTFGADHLKGSFDGSNCPGLTN